VAVSVDVEGLVPNASGAKLKIFSMADDPGNLITSDHLMNVQYRGTPGNPDNCIAFKALFASEIYKLEPDLARREASRFSLNPATTYHWRATWNTEFRLVVREGGSTASLGHTCSPRKKDRTRAPRFGMSGLATSRVRHRLEALCSRSKRSLQNTQKSPPPSLADSGALTLG
jgi:hypothetical protein